MSDIVPNGSELLHRLCDEFEQACKVADRKLPDVGAFLPDDEAECNEVAPRLFELLIELHHKQPHNTILAQEHFEKVPCMVKHPRMAELIRLQWEQLLKHNPNLTQEEYLKKFPGYLDKIDLGSGGLRPAASCQLPPRYEPISKIAEGGMGEVLRVRDFNIGRTVAAKVMLPNADKGRFQSEARITGQLVHPGIPSVHEIGESADGRPFYSMKLIEGRTLHDWLSDRQSPTIELPRFLKIFEQVAQTVAFAHSRRVIHRDLKPLNIVVGAFGEVQVIDWGLAKVVGRGNAAVAQAENLSANTSTGLAVSGTVPGTVLGTPAFMSPEQASGQVDELDERADVFALGAILCVILTGMPPYTGKDQDDILDKATNGDMAKALHSLETCGADAELIALAKRCLASDRELRPKGADEVVVAVAAYQASVQERLRQAELERAAAQARAEEEQAKASAERRARRLTLGLAAAVAVLMVGGVGAWWWSHHQKLRIEREQETQLRQKEGIRQAVEATLVQLPKFYEDFLFERAREVLVQAEDSLRGTDLDDLRQRVHEAQANRDFVAELDTIQLEKSQISAGKLDLASASPRYSEIFRKYGFDIENADVAELAHRIQGSRIKEHIIAALDDWAVSAPPEHLPKRLREITQLADQNPVREAARSGNLKQLNQLAKVVELRKYRPSTLLTLGAEINLAGGDGVILWMRAHRQYPHDFWVNYLLGAAFSIKPRNQSGVAVGYYRAALVRRPNSVAVLNSLGIALRESGDLDEAIATHLEATRLAPNDTKAHNNLGLALAAKKDFKGAIAAYNAAIRLDHNNSAAYNNLGVSLSNKKNPDRNTDAAKEAYAKAIQLDPGYAEVHSNLGIVLAEKKDLDGAIAAYKNAIKLNGSYAAAHNNFGVVLAENKKDLDAAISEYKEAIRLDASNAAPHSNLGKALRSKKDLTGAIAAYREAIRLDPKDAQAHTRLGNALQDKNQLDEALAAHKEAIRLDPTFAIAFSNLGTTLEVMNKLDAAVEAYRAAVRLDPGDAIAHSNLGNALTRKRDFKGAIAAHKEAVRLDPTSAHAQYNFGAALRDNKDIDGAIGAFQEAIRLDANYVKAHSDLGVALRGKGRLDEAITAFNEAIRMDPKYAPAHTNLGNALTTKGDLDGAIAAFKEAIRLDPRLPEPVSNLGVALSTKGDFDGAVAAFSVVIRFFPKFATAHYNLGLALLAKGNPTAAISAYSEAIRLDPNFVEAHLDLGNALLTRGHFEEAKTSSQRALKLLSANDPLQPVITLQIEQCDQLIEAQRKLPDILKERVKTKDANAQLNLAKCLHYKQHYATAVRFYSTAFLTNATLSDGKYSNNCYEAARAAALAAASKGENAADLDDAQRAGLRWQALDWLRAQLKAWSNLLNQDKKKHRLRVQRALNEWRSVIDLATVRDEVALANLPTAERLAWRQFWAEVEALVKRARDS